MPRRKLLEPKRFHHKPSGQDRVRIAGRDIYLGPHDSKESRAKYAEILRQLAADQPVETVAASVKRGTATTVPEADPGPSVAAIVLRFLKHAEVHYRKCGKQTSEVAAMKHAVGPLVELYGETPAAAFDTVDLKVVRDRMIDRGWVGSSINHNVSRVRRVFRHAAEDKLIPESVWVSLKTVRDLERYRSMAKETDKVKPVDDAAVNATLPHCTPIVRDIIRVQRLAGMRPGEATSMRWEEIDQSGEVWLYRPADHKLVHHGITRTITLGPQAQAILQARRGKGTGPVFGGRGGCFTTAAYRRAITRGCEIAFGMPDGLDADGIAAWRREHCWHPNQLRHTFATEQRKRGVGLDAIAASLGHTQVSTTQVYAEVNLEAAVRLAAAIG